MSKESASAGKAIIGLRDAIRNRFQIKVLMISLGGVLLSIFLSSLVFSLGMTKLARDTSDEIEYGFAASAGVREASVVSSPGAASSRS